MNRLYISFVFFMIFIGAVAAHGADQLAQTTLLEKISFEKTADGSERLLFKLTTSVDPKVFRIKGEKPRLVIDFFNTKPSPQVKNNFTTEGQLTKGVRVGIHNNPPKTRVVVDMATEQEYNFRLDTQDLENVLVLSLSSTEVQEKSAAEAVQTETVPDTEDQGTRETAVESVEVQSKATETEQTTATPQISPEQPTEPVDDDGPTPSTEQNLEKERHASAAAVEKVEDDPEEGAEARVDQIIANIKDETPPAADPILLDVSFESTANDSEMVLFKLNDFYPPIVFGIEKGNPRVVCDFLDTSLARTVQSVIQTKGLFVSRIRTARHPSPEKVRVVLDLVPNRNYDLQQVFFKEDNLFVIIISEYEGAAAMPVEQTPGSAQSD